MLSNKAYDVLKWIALYLLPAAGTLYFALAGIWKFPYGEEVVGTITAIDTFLAAGHQHGAVQQGWQFGA